MSIRPKLPEHNIDKYTLTKQDSEGPALHPYWPTANRSPTVMLGQVWAPGRVMKSEFGVKVLFGPH